MKPVTEHPTEQPYLRNLCPNQSCHTTAGVDSNADLDDVVVVWHSNLQSETSVGIIGRFRDRGRVSHIELVDTLCTSWQHLSISLANAMTLQASSTGSDDSRT